MAESESQNLHIGPTSDPSVETGMQAANAAKDAQPWVKEKVREKTKEKKSQRGVEGKMKVHSIEEIKQSSSDPIRSKPVIDRHLRLPPRAEELPVRAKATKHDEGGSASQPKIASFDTIYRSPSARDTITLYLPAHYFYTVSDLPGASTSVLRDNSSLASSNAAEMDVVAETGLSSGIYRMLNKDERSYGATYSGFVEVDIVEFAV